MEDILPKEFTPELNEDLYNTLAKRISARGESSAGRARSEALSRGLGGDPYEASAVGMARQGTQDELGALDSDLAYRTAGFGREERLGRESRGYQVEDRDFAAKEAEKERNFRETMALRNMDWQGDMANTANRRQQQAALWQLPFQVGGAVAGGWASGGFK